jgi:diaminopimelate epimerase
MKILFTKAHGARNDFLLTWRADAPEENRPEIAMAICDRHTRIGADGWMLVAPPEDAEADGTIELYNSDGSVAEISGNGTRCAAALLVRHGHAAGAVRVRTGAGIKSLRLLGRKGLLFDFEMNMGCPEVRDPRHRLRLRTCERESVVMWVGNPQCALLVPDFDFDWRAMGAEIERHADFPNRTNVSFVRPLDGHTIDVRFWERGAGETMSSGTGSTGAVAAALAHGLVSSPVEVMTPAGPIHIRIDGEFLLTGPAEITAEGQFFFEG